MIDTYATHKKAEVREWLAANPRIHVHYTPPSASASASASWMNLVEVWSGSSNAKRSTAALSAVAANSRRRSESSSTGGIRGHSRSSGRKPPNRSRRKMTAEQLRTRGTSFRTRCRIP
nr:hypothetical protein [Rhodococcus sp. ACPA4]